jgi:hypothetical protein
MNSVLKSKGFEAINLLLAQLQAETSPQSVTGFLKIKAEKSGGVLASKLGLNDSLLEEFIQAWKKFEHTSVNPSTEKINNLRFLIWMDGDLDHPCIQKF